MRICFFSDIHGNRYAFDAFLQDIRNENFDKMIFGGDFFGYYYDINYIITKVRELNIYSLLGNHDKMFLDILDNKISEDSLTEKYGSTYKGISERISIENKEYIRKLKSSCELDTNIGKIGFFHGSPSDPINGRVYPDTIITDTDKFKRYKIVMMGHTHHKMVREIDNTLLLNPGSLGQQRDGRGTSYLIYDTNKNNYEFKIVQYDVNVLIRNIDEKDNGNGRLKEVLLRKRS